MSFRDKFKGKTETVGRDGSNAMLPEVARRPSNAPSLRGTQERTPSNAAPTPVSTANTVQLQTLQPQMYGMPMQQPMPFGVMPQPPMLPVGGAPFGMVPPFAPGFPPGGVAPTSSLLPPKDQRSVQPDTNSVNSGEVQTRSRRPFLAQTGAVTPKPADPGDADGSPSQKRDRRKPLLPDFKSIPAFQRREPRITELQQPILGDYKSYGVPEYRQMIRRYQREKFPRGLGPNITEIVIQEKEKKQRILDYGRAVNAVNFAMMEVAGENLHNRPIVHKLTPEAEIGRAKRDRALAFAERIKSQTPQPVLSKESMLRELQRLEEKHRKDQDAIHELKRQLKIEPDRYRDHS